MTVWFTPANGERSELDISSFRAAKRQLSDRDRDYLARLAAQEKALSPEGGWWRHRLGCNGRARVLKRQAVAAALEAGCSRRQISIAAGATARQIATAIYVSESASRRGRNPDLPTIECLPRTPGVAHAILRLLHEHGPMRRAEVCAHLDALNPSSIKQILHRLYKQSRLEPVAPLPRDQTWRITEKGIACLLRS